METQPLVKSAVPYIQGQTAKIYVVLLPGLRLKIIATVNLMEIKLPKFFTDNNGKVEIAFDLPKGARSIALEICSYHGADPVGFDRLSFDLPSKN
jgi:hypothetical protein